LALPDAPSPADQADLDLARRIILERLAPQGARVWLFGSRARGAGGRGSDIDVAFLPARPLPPGLLQEIRETLEESLILYPVDLVDLTSADPGLREKVLREGIPWTT
jgi:predicted nucleotidyltransferase